MSGPATDPRGAEVRRLRAELASARREISDAQARESIAWQSHLDTLATARERAKSAEAEVERLGAEVVHLERELRIRVAKLAASGAA